MAANSGSLFPRLESPDPAPALRVGDSALDYAALARACAVHRARLDAAGANRGDAVAVWTHPGIEAAVALVANARAGVVSVPLNPALGPRELAHIVVDAAPVFALSARPDVDAPRTPGLRTVSLVARDASSARAGLGDEARDEGAPLLVLYTSGTTGAPKGAVLTRGNVASNLDALAAAWEWTAADALAHALPLFHVHGLVLGLFGALRVGASLRWITRFSPESIAHELARGATMLFGVPTMYHRLAEAAERDADVARALGGARLLVSGSAPLPTREHARIERATGQRVVERYGLTETLINCAVRARGDRRPGYVGPPVDGVELRLVDDARATLAAHDDATIGEVAVRGPNVFAGYLHRDDATRAVRDAAGWFYTGDLATVAPDGYVRIVGRRATDLIKTGGFKVGAGEVESALLEHAAVLEAAVLGEPDDDLGERIVAYVVLRPDAPAPASDALAHFVAAQLAPHKRPRAVRFVAELPRNAMGKVVKSTLRAGAGGG